MFFEAFSFNSPEKSIHPFKNISDNKSTIPEPHIPKGFLFSIVVYFILLSTILIVSIAPSFALIPNLLIPPSNAGPAAPATATKNSSFPITSSPFVPISINAESSFCLYISVNNTPLTISPPR